MRNSTEYDEPENRVLERDALGNTLTRTFSRDNQVLTETRYRLPDSTDSGAPDGPVTSRFAYDTASRLRFAVSSEGRVTENRYGSGSGAAAGLLVQTRVYTGEVFDVTGLAPTHPLGEVELAGWAAGLSDKSRVQLTENEYDRRGNLRRQTRYATVSETGDGVLDAHASVMEFAYDEHGRLRLHVAVRGPDRDQHVVIARFEYDGMDRELVNEGVNGRRVTAYGGGGRRVVVNQPGGLVETREFDARGRLAAVTLDGDGTSRPTRHVHDNADRLRMDEDAEGGRRFRFYDPAGRLGYAVDGTGAVTRSERKGLELNNTPD